MFFSALCDDVHKLGAADDDVVCSRKARDLQWTFAFDYKCFTANLHWLTFTEIRKIRLEILKFHTGESYTIVHNNVK